MHELIEAKDPSFFPVNQSGTEFGLSGTECGLVSSTEFGPVSSRAQKQD